jgi:hypothetical protein
LGQKRAILPPAFLAAGNIHRSAPSSTVSVQNCFMG